MLWQLASWSLLTRTDIQVYTCVCLAQVAAVNSGLKWSGPSLKNNVNVAFCLPILMISGYYMYNGTASV